MSPTKKEESTAVTIADLSVLIERIGQAIEKSAETSAIKSAEVASATIKEYLEESRKPSRELLAKRAREARQAKREEETRLAKEASDQAACTHIHPDNGKSRFAKFPVAYPYGAWGMMCTKCFKRLQNYEIVTTSVEAPDGFEDVVEIVRIITNHEFNEWFPKASVADSVRFS